MKIDKEHIMAAMANLYYKFYFSVFFKFYYLLLWLSAGCMLLYSWNAVVRLITEIGMTTVTSAALYQSHQSSTVLCQCPAVLNAVIFTVDFVWDPMAYVTIWLLAASV